MRDNDNPVIDAALTLGFLYLLWRWPGKTISYTLLAVVLLAIVLTLPSLRVPQPAATPVGSISDYEAAADASRVLPKTPASFLPVCPTTTEPLWIATRTESFLPCFGAR